MALDQSLLLADCRNEDGRHSIEMQSAYCRLLASVAETAGTRLEATVKLAQLLHNQHQPLQSLKVLDELLSEQPNAVSALEMKGMILTSTQDFETAISTFDRMVEAAPKNFRAYALRAGGHLANGDHKAAIDDFNRALDLGPDDSMALSGRAAAYQDSGNHDRAIRDYTAVIRLEPENCRHYLERAAANLDAGNYRDGIEDLNTSIDLDEDNPAAYARLGEVSLSFDAEDTEKADVARLMLGRAAELDPDDGNIQLNLGRAEARLGNTEPAMNAFRRSVELIPELLVAYKASLASRGHYDGSIDQVPDDQFWHRLRDGIDNHCKFMEPIE